MSASLIALRSGLGRTEFAKYTVRQNGGGGRLAGSVKPPP